MFTSHRVALLLTLAPASGVLSTEAAEYNAKAMHFYKAGELALAVDEFYAAYQAMPDPRRDLAGREQVLGSLRGTLLDLYDRTGEAAVLCRLQGILDEHLRQLTAAFPDAPNRLEIHGARERHAEVTRLLAALAPDVCAPPPPPAPLLPVTPPPAPPPTPAVAPPSDVTDATPRHMQIAGGVMVPLGLVAFAVVGGVASRHGRSTAEADAIHDELATRPRTVDDRTRLRELLAATHRDEGIIIGSAVAGAALLTVGTVLLVRGTLQRRRIHLGLDVRREQVAFTLSGEF
ncbi:MAG TPA: hypothetical protein VGB85_04455 [Nannocystis sp.]